MRRRAKQPTKGPPVRVSRRGVEAGVCAVVVALAVAGVSLLLCEPGEPARWRPTGPDLERLWNGAPALGVATGARTALGVGGGPGATAAAIPDAPGVVAGDATGGGGGATATLVAATAGADGAPGSDAQAAEEAPARLVGRVIGPDELPARGVTVSARPLKGKPPRPEPVETDATGAFAFELPAGSWRLSASAEGFVSTRVDVAVKAGETAERDLALIPAVDGMAGTVRTSDGRPIAGARVTVERGGRAPVRRRAETGPDGAFVVGDLPEGLFTVHAEAGGFAAGRSRDVPVASGKGGVAELVLREAARLEVVVRRTDGTPAAGVRLELVRNRRAVAKGRADDAGRVLLEDLAEGEGDVVVTASKGRVGARVHVAVVAERLTALALVLGDAPTITGRVVDEAGAPRVGARVVASLRGGRLRREARTDADGRYAIGRLLPGSYWVHIPRRNAPPVASGDADLSQAPTAECDLVAREETTVRGVALAPDGTPLARANVVAVIGGRERARARTNAEGRFELRGLPEGEAHLMVRSRRDEYVASVAQLVPRDAVIDVRISTRAAARLRGRLVGPDGAPLAGVSFVVRGGPVRRNARTGDDGAFDCGPLYDGEYQLVAERGPLRLVARQRGVAGLDLEPVTFAVAQGRDVACELRASETK